MDSMKRKAEIMWLNDLECIKSSSLRKGEIFNGTNCTKISKLKFFIFIMKYTCKKRKFSI